MKKKNFAPKLYPLNKDIRANWFVKYYDHAGRPKKMYGSLNSLHSVAERDKEGERIIKHLVESVNIAVPAGNGKKDDIVSLMGELVEYKRPFMEYKSYQTYFSLVSMFATWYRAESQKKDVAPGDYIRHMNERGLAKNTIRRNLIVLRGLCTELLRQNKIIENPFVGIKAKKVRGASKLPFSPAQVVKLKEAVQAKDMQLWHVIEFMYYLYLRPKEVRLLKVGDIYFDTWQLQLSGDIAKDDDTISKAIPLPLRKNIEYYRDLNSDYYLFSKNGVPGATPLGINHLSARMRVFIKGFNMGSRYSLYSWVHTGIKNAALGGIPIKQLQLQKGHADLKMFDEYMKNLGIDDCTQLVTDFPAI